MSRYRSTSRAMEELARSGTSRYRKARVRRFIYRHAKKHRKIIARLNQRDRYHERACRERFVRMKGGAA